MPRKKKAKLFEVRVIEEQAVVVTWRVTAVDADDARDKYHAGERTLVGKDTARVIDSSVDSVTEVKK